MIIRWLLLFSGLCGAFIIFTIVNYWQIDNVGRKILFGHQFSSEWTFRGAYALLMSAPIVAVNVFMWFLYSKGYNDWFEHNIWQVQIIFWASGVLIAIAMNWWWYGQWPTKGALVAIPGVVGLSLLAIFWK